MRNPMSSPVNASSQLSVPSQDSDLDVVPEVNSFVSLSEAILHSSEDAIFSTTLQGVVTSWNPAATRLYGYRADKMLGDATTLPFFPDRLLEKAHLLDRLKRIESFESFDSTHLHQDGTAMPVSLTVFAIRNAAQEAIGIGTIARKSSLAPQNPDVEELPLEGEALSESHSLSARLAEANTRLVLQIRRANAQSDLLESQTAELRRANRRLEELNARLEALAATDSLTGLKNHRVFQERLLEEVNRAVRYGAPLSILLMDIDRFKTYNDAFGHPAGDAILRRIAEVVQTKARTTDLVARYGGEEFAIILPETDGEPARTAAERFRTAIEIGPWPEWPVTASFGVATLSPTTPDAKALIAQADAALYRSKRIGRNCVTHAMDSLPTESAPVTRDSPAVNE
jgi:diguanylate cyclase (GGDEF)-like protein/PAS domain S-box-containing protein